MDADSKQTADGVKAISEQFYRLQANVDAVSKAAAASTAGFAKLGTTATASIGNVASGALAGLSGGMSLVVTKIAEMATKIQDFADNAIQAFSRATAAASAFVAVGFIGTLEANRLSFQFQLLSREVAGIFVPTMEKVQRIVQNIAASFRRLTENQQAGIRMFGEFAVATTASYQAINGLSAALESMTGIPIPTVLKAIAAIGAGLALTFRSVEQLEQVFQPLLDSLARFAVTFGDLMLDIGNAITDVLVPAIIVLTKQLQVMLGLLTVATRIIHGGLVGAGVLRQTSLPEGKQKTSVTPGQVGFEGIGDTFKRIQESVLKLGLEDPNAKTAKNTELMLREQEKSNIKLGEIGAKLGMT